jgi:hypothetical protein
VELAINKAGAAVAAYMHNWGIDGSISYCVQARQRSPKGQKLIIEK